MSYSLFFQNNFTIIAIVSAFFAAIANILARTLLKDLRSRDIIGINFLTLAVTLLIFSPLFYHFDASLLAFGLIILIALIDALANFFYFKTFEQTEASVATPILSLAPAVTFLTGWIFLTDIASWQTYLYAIAIIFLVIYFSVDLKNFSKFKNVTLFPALAASFLFGISAIPTKYLLSTLKVINAPTLFMFRAGFIALFALLIFKFPLKRISFHQYWFIFIRGLFVIAQWVLLYFALSVGNAGVTITLGNITPIFVFIISLIFLKEHFTWKKAIAAILILVLSIII
jgi:drug/metabolite transporter (DMT)-like permease